MKRMGVFLCMAWMVMGAAAAEVTDAEIALATQGNYRGGFTDGPWQEHWLTIHLIAQNNREHLANFYFGPHEEGTPMFSIQGRTEEGVTRFSGDVSIEGAGWFGTQRFEGEIVTAGNPPVAGPFTGTLDGPGGVKRFEAERVELGSPSMGAEPPAGAVVLFDGSSMDDWERYPLTWGITGEGAFQVGGSDLITKEQFGSKRLHLEFRTPFMPSARGQQRGNSGVYIQGVYEIQVLDTFGLEPADNFCGGFYQQAPPIVNACLPPMEWQTYEIDFQAPKFNDAGEKTQNARVTVHHNGILIHDDLELTDRTPGGMGGPERAAGNLLLQDHGDRVQFRNIWILPVED
jgi:hypothetical protein